MSQHVENVLGALVGSPSRSSGHRFRYSHADKHSAPPLYLAQAHEDGQRKMREMFFVEKAQLQRTVPSVVHICNVEG
jgi:hypothetical protein